MLQVRWQGVREMRRDLKAFAGKAVPYANRNAVNTAAFEARRQWQGEIKRAFTLRNQFTVNSIRVDKAELSDGRRMSAIVGSLAPYMRTQEEGGTDNKSSIPGPSAAGQPPGGKRTKVVRAGLRIGRISVAKIRARNRRQFNAASIAIAKRRGLKVALLHRPGGAKGLFEIRGTKSKPTQRLLHTVGRGNDRIPPTPTLGRTIHRMEARLPRIHYDAVLEQLKRHKIAGY